MERRPVKPERAASTANREAARTTIVGGQPPGNARELPPVPVGLEQLLALAATSEAFAATLKDDPRRAAEAAGIVLTASEQAILAAVDRATLTAMIGRVAPTLPEPERRRFLELATAAVALVVSGAALPGCEDTTPSGQRRSAGPPTATGVRPDRPEPPQTTTGVRPDRPYAPNTETGSRPDRPNEPPPPTGIRPDRPPKPPRPAPDAGAAQGTAPDPPRPRPAERHNRGGVRPDRREKLCITGIRPTDDEP